MVEFDPSRGTVNLMGTLVSIDRARRMKGELETALQLAEFYENHPEIRDIAVNELTLKHLSSPSDDDYPMKIGLSFTDDAEIVTDYFTKTTYESDSHNLIDAIVPACDIPAVFEESTGLEAFKVEIPDPEEYS